MVRSTKRRTRRSRVVDKALFSDFHTNVIDYFSHFSFWLLPLYSYSCYTASIKQSCCCLSLLLILHTHSVGFGGFVQFGLWANVSHSEPNGHISQTRLCTKQHNTAQHSTAQPSQQKQHQQQQQQQQRHHQHPTNKQKQHKQQHHDDHGKKSSCRFCCLSASRSVGIQ